MIQRMRNSLSAVSPGASEFAADDLAVSNEQLYAIHAKEISGDGDSFLDSFPGAHSSTIAYVSACQKGNRMIYVGPQIGHLGFTQDAWLGKPALRLQQVHKEDLDRVQKAMEHTCNTAEKFDCHYRLYDNAGRVHWFHDEASVVCDESGDPLFVMGAMRDITEMKTMEEELNEHRYYLEKKVEQRTEQLVRRINLLESCNATLCDKLAQARRDISELHKQLDSALSGIYPSECPAQVIGISDEVRQRVELEVGMFA